MSEYIDTSMSSLILGLVVLAISAFFFNYTLTNYFNEEQSYSENQIMFFSLILSIILSFLVLVAYKQYLIKKGSTVVDTSSFFN